MTKRNFTDTAVRIDGSSGTTSEHCVHVSSNSILFWEHRCCDRNTAYEPTNVCAIDNQATH